MKQKLLFLLVLLLTATTGAWATPNSIVINGTPQVGDKSISLTYHFDPANVPGITSFAPTLKVKCAADNKWDETNLSLHEVSSGTTIISLSNLGEFKAGKTYEVCFAYNNGNWVDEVFQSFVPAGPATYTVTLAEGTEDADKWSVKVGEKAAAFPVEGLEGGETITATYSGTRKVKSVKAVKKAAVDPAKAYLTWDADQKKLVATEIPATAIKVASADAAVTWEAGTYVVEDDVTIKGFIRLSGNVDLIIKDDATLTANKIQGGNKNLRIYGQANKSGQLVVNSTTDAISDITTLEVHSAKVTATASANSCGGFSRITTFNVYDGLVDAKGTGSNGYGITLKEGGSLNIYGGEVKAEGKGNNVNYSYGIRCGNSLKATVTVYGGKLWAGNADNKALKYITLAIDKSLGFNGEIECSPDNSTWNPTVGTPDEKYVRVGY